VFSVHQVPEHDLCYAEPRWLPDGRPDIPASLDDLPKGHEWEYTLFADIGFFPDPFAYVLWAWSWTDRRLLEVCSWRANKLDATDQLAVLTWVAEQAPPSIVGGDIGGAATPMGKDWSRRWEERFGYPLEEAEKHRKYEHLMLMNADIRKGAVKMRRGSPLHDQSKRVLWAPRKGSGKLKEDPAIPNDVTDAGLYGHRHTMQHLAKAPAPKRPAYGTSDYFNQIARQLEDDEEVQGDGERDSYYS